MQKARILDDHELRLTNLASPLDRRFTDANERGNRRATALGTKTGISLRELSVFEGCSREHVGGDYIALSASPFDANFGEIAHR